MRIQGHEISDAGVRRFDETAAESTSLGNGLCDPSCGFGASGLQDNFDSVAVALRALGLPAESLVPTLYYDGAWHDAPDLSDLEGD